MTAYMRSNVKHGLSASRGLSAIAELLVEPVYTVGLRIAQTSADRDRRDGGAYAFTVNLQLIKAQAVWHVIANAIVDGKKTTGFTPYACISE